MIKLRYPFAMECGVYRTSYEQDLAYHPTRLAVARGWLIVALLFALPLFLRSYFVSLLIQVLFFSIAAIGLNILTGFAGQISIGHGAFLGMGAFTTGWLMIHLHLPFWIALPLGGLAAAAVGALFGLPSARLKGLYLAIASIAAQVILDFFFIKAKWFTGGVDSMNVPRPTLFGFTFRSETHFYYLGLIIALLLGLFAMNLLRTRMGRAFVAVRDRDLAAELMGVELWQTKVLAFALSAFYAGIAGGFWGAYIRIINHEQFGFHLSIELLAIIIIGGLGSVMGSIYGAVFMTLLPILVRELATFLGRVIPALGENVTMLKDITFGVAIILFLVYESEGLQKLWRNIKDYFKLWPFSY
jgi:branched-chain amino acid transport system permease protein